jgi:endoglucanase
MNSLSNFTTIFIRRIFSTAIIILFSYLSVVCQTDINLTAVSKNGLIKVKGNSIVNADGNPTAIRGMSMFWSQWMGKFYNYDCIKWLRDDWNCEIIRIALATNKNGYETNPEEQMKLVINVVDACIDLGIYAIVDWHSHNAQNEIRYAMPFFKEIARRYGTKPNLIYEIYNEPLNVSWQEVVKPYCDTIIGAIREIDPDNLIIVGTPNWSQDVDEAALNPIKDANVAYSVHFYAGTHKQWLRDKVDIALSKGLPIFVTEFGTCDSNGNGAIDYEETKTWLDYMSKNNISWCNWSVSDKDETSSILKNGASDRGRWKPEEITESGTYIRKVLKEK